MKIFHRTLFILLVFIAASCKSAQKNPTANEVSNYANSITAEELKTHLDIIASDEMEGRDTGSPGQKKAGQYLISQYKASDVPHPTAATDYYQRIPAAFFAKSPRSKALPDSENVWAFIEGTEKPEEIVVVSAHYDHVGIKNGQIHNGADDDGSGTAALLEIAEAFMEAKKAGHGPKRSVLILHVTGEEHGLHGSRFYSENPLYPLANTVADVNIDMIGRRDDIHPETNNYIYVIGADRLSTDLHKIVVEANQKFVNLDLDFRFNAADEPNRYYFRSDHYNFAKNGIPSVFFFNGVHADYHKPSDTPEKIEYDAFTKRAKLAFLTAWEIANREQRLVVDKDGK
ncbi:MAG TPA: M28 family peptidase [Flavobacterium sp.]|jgi:hypothetical protein